MTDPYGGHDPHPTGVGPGAAGHGAADHGATGHAPTGHWGTAHAPRGPSTVPPAPPARDDMGAVPWTMVDALGIIAVTAVATLAVVFGAAVLALLRLPAEALLPVLLPLPLILLGLVTVIWVQVRYGAARRLMGPAPARAQEWLVGFGIGVCAFLVVNIGLSLVLQLLGAVAGFEVPRPQAGAREAIADPQLLPWLVLAAVVVAPVAEELFFRGLLQQSLRRRMRAWLAVALSAVIFAAAHILQELGGSAGPVAFVLILPLGLLLGSLFERRGSLAMPIAVHAAFNLVTVGVLAIGMTVL